MTVEMDVNINLPIRARRTSGGLNGEKFRERRKAVKIPSIFFCHLVVVTSVVLSNELLRVVIVVSLQDPGVIMEVKAA